MNIQKTWPVLFITLFLTFEVRATDSLANQISRITMDCQQNGPEATETLHQILVFGLERITKINPELKSHIISRMKKKAIHIKCGFDQKTIEELSLPAMADAVTSDFWEANKVQITIQDRTVKNLVDFKKNPTSIYEMDFLLAANSLTHELLHAADVDNHESTVHNSLGKHGILGDQDVIYACSYLAFPIFPESSVIKDGPLARNCESCYFARKRSSRDLRSQSRDSEPVRIEIRSQLRLKEQAWNACEPLKFNLEDIFSN